MDNKTRNPVIPHSSLISAIRRLLSPLAKLMLAHGITYPFLAEMLKSVLVDVAQKNFSLDQKRLTHSRITVLTGVHRQDVKRLANADDVNESLPEASSLGARMVTRWISQPEYLDRKKRPMPLPRLAAAAGGARSFEALVESVNKNIRPRTILDELIRLGIVGVDDEDRVCLNAEAFIPEQGFDEKAYYFGQHIHDHMAAAVHNLLGETPPFVERSLIFQNLTPQSAAELQRLATKLGMQALQTVYRRAREVERKDASAPDNGVQISYGVYFFSAQASEPIEQQEANTSKRKPAGETP